MEHQCVFKVKHPTKAHTEKNCGKLALKIYKGKILCKHHYHEVVKKEKHK